MNIQFNNKLQELIIKYKIDKEDPLFAILEIQFEILQETKKTLENKNNNMEDNFEKNYKKLEEEFYFILKNRINDSDKLLKESFKEILKETQNDLKKFKEEIELDIIENSNNKNLKYLIFKLLQFLIFFSMGIGGYHLYLNKNLLIF